MHIYIKKSITFCNVFGVETTFKQDTFLHISPFSAHFPSLPHIPSLAPKKELRNSEALFLSNPKDWYVITLQRVCNRPRRMASPWCMQSFVLITYRNKFRITFTALRWLHTQLKLRLHSVQRRITYTAHAVIFYFQSLLSCYNLQIY